jgi:CDP-diglyceride synthetase
MHPLALFLVLVLIMLANGTPVVAKRILGDRFTYPLDGNIVFFDGRPLFGSSKTVRGVVLALIVTAAGALLLGLSTTVGLVVAATAMAGDAFSSFVKRRLGLSPHSRATGLDQIPESLFPLLACQSALGLNAADIVAGVVIFLIGEILASRALFRLRVRDRPY